jgi:HAD superfamily hydrolase (TIGR01549 family)
MVVTPAIAYSATVSGAVLLDLDETLVLTSRIEPLRKSRRWAQAYREFDQTTLPPYTRAFLLQVRPIARIGVVTTSPRPYAERLLAHHGLDVPVLVAYHDTGRHKPFPDPILRALEILNVPASNAVHIGDLDEDDTAARAAGVASVLVCWAGGSSAEGVCRSWEEVVNAILRAVPEV